MLHNFEAQINAILKLNEIGFQLSNGKMVNSLGSQINQSSLETVQEVGLKELLQQASRYYDEDNLQIAVEKLWDAFERLKTYYCSSTIDKKKSAEKIVKDMGDSQQAYMELFEKEFRELTLSYDHRRKPVIGRADSGAVMASPICAQIKTICSDTPIQAICFQAELSRKMCRNFSDTLMSVPQ